jgi:hypothetical protein
MIDSYDFGRMVISGKVYSSDLIIFPDKILSSWWRKTGHRLCMEDLKEVLKEDFDILVVGTGYMGLMKVEKEVIEHAHAQGFHLRIEKTRKAVEAFNRLSGQKKRTIGAFHLTC